MAKYAVYEKAIRFRNNMSHSHREDNHVRKVNVKSVKVKTEGDVRKVYICTSCLRSSFTKKA